ncbi:tRNA pseudouridine(38-40) synthase TruA [Caldibacillus thermolactis]|jgi:tRNA pseudouridine38-40 synthase|uniref:tRNA pseudouridine synthase A n=1 Tax=Pallidibacillus thermolactis TaxID=251051 RepID=A0ABT2WJ70_9BACI|nr:tRNA pseudouridine(38-40) synthase TruA [Pallidibacillus thermolactis]MCU9594062.1 tRNA pseudouridine(38-40) synthase TruA [Pallidibacillus thermolactis]MCU9602199.1 tRNA pseudouridine(38-40) synthase TruA [Pallidibacillus thermolactis subsp. kokeshiiformis]MED1673206.1 tRNA pseudouridine(38-40) synthase TruA [Pallidibacillus thermolactis subsp. kokeshiiformis]
MNRVKCIISYDGSDFVGYQVQPNGRTVQGEIEKVLSRMHKGEFVRIHGSGRTDRGVHAKGQVIHFDTYLDLKGEQWTRALNAQLPEDIVVLTTESVDCSFHARFSAKGKEYHYYLYRDTKRNPFLRNYAFHYPYPLEIDSMKKALEFFLGTHDFTSFSSAKSDIEDRVRTIDMFRLVEEEQKLIFKIKGNGFLYNMVRIIVGTVLEVGEGKRKPEDVLEILQAKNRGAAGKTVPGHGLYLYKVYY